MDAVVQQRSTAAETRLLFIDNIRWVLIVVVICHHAAVTYSHIGSWYYTDPPQPSLVTTMVLATFETFNQAYFMGFLFLIAGYFVPGAYDSKGAMKFARDRAIRLGIPAAFFMLVLHPVIVYWLLRTFEDPSIPSLGSAYLRFLSSGRVFSASGPMWFAVALLIFCLVYAGVRLSGVKGFNEAKRAGAFMPGHGAVAGLILTMGTCSFLARIAQPIGASVLNMQLGYFPQYILLFVVGVLAYRGDWLRGLSSSLGRLWMKLAGTVGVAAWFLIVATSGAMQGDTRRMLGGFHWESAAFCYWEAFFCMGMCLGLTALFRDRFNRQGQFAEWMSRNSFSAYLFHTPLLVAVSLTLKNFSAPPLVKFAAASLAAVPLTFAISGFIRSHVTGLKRLL